MPLPPRILGPNTIIETNSFALQERLSRALNTREHFKHFFIGASSFRKDFDIPPGFFNQVDIRALDCFMFTESTFGTNFLNGFGGSAEWLGLDPNYTVPNSHYVTSTLNPPQVTAPGTDFLGKLYRWFGLNYDLIAKSCSITPKGLDDYWSSYPGNMPTMEATFPVNGFAAIPNSRVLSNGSTADFVPYDPYKSFNTGDPNLSNPPFSLGPAVGSSIVLNVAGTRGCIALHPLVGDGTLRPAAWADITEIHLQTTGIRVYNGDPGFANVFWIGRKPEEVPNTNVIPAPPPFLPSDYRLFTVQ